MIGACSLLLILFSEKLFSRNTFISKRKSNTEVSAPPQESDKNLNSDLDSNFSDMPQSTSKSNIFEKFWDIISEPVNL